MTCTTRHIFCLEGNWNKNPKSKKSIRPVLELLHTSCDVKYIYYKCHNKNEFTENLKKYTQKRYKNYPVLYLAFHGKRNRIYFGKEYITLKEIAAILEGKMQDKIVYFGSCSTLQTSPQNIDHFITQTECSCISGYLNYVDFIVSTAFELIYLQTLQSYKSLHRVSFLFTSTFK